MERLTEKHVKKNGGYFMRCSEFCEREETMCLECERSDEIVDRLGAIEDILGGDYDLDRLRELVEADRDGRCVVLPCKVGDELFYSDGEWIGKETVEKIVIDIETGGGIYAPRDIGYSVYKSAEEAEAVLKEDQHG